MFFSAPPPPTSTYPLSLHDALPISCQLAGLTLIEPTPCMNSAILSTPSGVAENQVSLSCSISSTSSLVVFTLDRKSTRLNSSHLVISYAVFCLQKKKNKNPHVSTVT